MKIIGIIPARGGSKGIPKKNLNKIGEKSLLELAIECSHKSNALNRLILSTDNEEIANVGRSFGAEVPFIRPAELADDDTPDFQVFLHTIKWLKHQEKYEVDFAVWLRPTSPLREANDISQAIKLIRDTGADSVRSVCKVEHHPYWMKTIDENFTLNPIIAGSDESKYYRRQLLPDIFRLNGAVEVINVNSALKHNQLYGEDIRGYVMPVSRSLDIDTYEDLKYADFIFKTR